MHENGDNKVYLLAVQFAEQKQYVDAINLFEKLPQTNEIKYNIATCYKEQKTYESLTRSKELFEQIINNTKERTLQYKIYTNYISTITYLTEYYITNALYESAIKITIDALMVCPENPILLYNSGYLYRRIGQYDIAAKYLCSALQKNPEHRDGYLELINIYQDMFDLQNMFKYINLGIYHIKNDATLYNCLGLYYTSLYKSNYCSDEYKKAMNAFSFAESLCRSNCEDTKISVTIPTKVLAKVYTNIGHLYSLVGNISMGLSYFDKAFECDSTDMIPLQNYAMDMLYLDTIAYSDTIRKHMLTGYILQRHNKLSLIPPINHINPIIHIGYVSGDFFGTHPMIYFIKHLLNDYNPTLFKVFCYSINQIGDTSRYSDKITWYNIKNMSLLACTRQILSDKINILIDLSGHTSGNRMDIFSNRVAQLQLSYLGYPCITGMPDIDYHIIDKTFNFKCKTVEMQNCFTHYDIPFKIQTLIQPYNSNGYITFGCFNKVSKINKKVLDLWDSILDTYPTAIILIKKRYELNMRNQKRIIVVKIMPKYIDYIRQYNQIDIALDTFPYAGTTTTCESLFMGTPVITLADRKTNAIHQNTTASILINSGLSELVSTNKEEYLYTIGNIVNKIYSSKTYKNEIQHKFLTGNVTNSKQYMNDFENLIMTLWNKCKV